MLETVVELLENKEYKKLKEMLSDMNEADIASILVELPEDKLVLIYRILPKELAAEVFVNMDSDAQEVLIHSFSDNELKEVLDELYVDDAVDIHFYACFFKVDQLYGYQGIQHIGSLCFDGIVVV